MRAKTVAALLVILVALAFLLRVLGLEVVFPGDGTTVFLSWDSFYHARRALFGFVNFPHVLGFDSYVSHPLGAPLPWPPLYDFLLAGGAKLAGADEASFDATIAWIPPALAAMTVPFVYVAARAIGTPGLALGAAAIFTLLPASSLQSSIGVTDHHSAVALFSTALLACGLQALRAPLPPARRAVVFLGLALSRAALVLTWPGGALFIGLLDGFLLLAAAWLGRRDLAEAEFPSALGSAALVAPWSLSAVSSVGGAFSMVELSPLHAVALFALALVSGAVAVGLRLRPVRGLAGLLRLALAGGLAGGVAVAALGAPGGGGGLARFLVRDDPWAAVNLEQVPLSQFSIPGSFPDGPMLLFGAFYYVAGLAIVAVAARARDPQRRPAVLCLAVFTLVLGVLAVRQVRFAVDFAPAAAISFAILTRDAVDWLAPARTSARQRAVAALVAGALLLSPALYGIHLQRLLFSHRYLVSRSLAVPDRALLTHEGTLVRFAQQVRAATPETAGFLDEGRPEYGITTFAGLGHVLHQVARRATPADNFGHYVGAEPFFASQAVYELEDEAEAVEALERLKTPYLVTADLGGPESAGLLHRLHRHDGGAVGGRPAFGRFRLVTEGPAGGQPIGTLFGGSLPASNVPYKLFQVVEGALLEVAAPPGAEVSAELLLETPLGRRFRYRTAAGSGSDGIARLRLPYASGGRQPVRSLGPWTVRSGGLVFAVEVDDAAVTQGRTVRAAAGG